MGNSQKPVIDPHALIAPVEDGYVAYNPTNDQLYELNPLAAVIVELANGERSIDDIRGIASPLLPDGEQHKIDDWIDEAVAAGLLSYEAAERSDETNQGLSSKELVELADRLRDAGKVQTAFMCQQRAAELSPDEARIFRHLGELAHIVGKREKARNAYQRYLELNSDDAEIEHLLVSLRDDDAPSRVPNACIEQLYQRFSSFYESNMCDELGYEGPQHLVNALLEKKPDWRDRSDLSVLDLGCGTGLAGEQIKSSSANLIGIDLSAEMIEIARQRDIYDELSVAEVTQWLDDAIAAGQANTFDLIMACDTLIYFGDLSQVIRPALQLLKPNGTIAFSVESADQPPWRLTDSGRYVHHVSYLELLANDFELQINFREEFLRMEYGSEVMALYVVLNRANP